MKAMVYEKYGSTKNLKLKDVDKPAPKDNEVLIKVFAVSINDWDLGLLYGTPFINRIFSGLFHPKVNILGSDVAGQIISVGKNVKRFKVGDSVFGDISGKWGGFAEYVCANEKLLVLKQSEMTYEQAASIPQAAMLAVQGLIDKGDLKKNQSILINGAGGGVGTFGIQLAKLFVVEVTGVDNSIKLEFMRSMGFDHVIDYEKEDFTKNAARYDLILDVKTNRSIFKYIHVLKKNGVYVTVGGSMIRLLQAAILNPIIKTFSKKNVRIVALKPNKDLEYIKKLFQEDKLKPVIDGNYEFNDIPSALKRFSEGKQMGKIVITVNN